MHPNFHAWFTRRNSITVSLKNNLFRWRFNACCHISHIYTRHWRHLGRRTLAGIRPSLSCRCPFREKETFWVLQAVLGDLMVSLANKFTLRVAFTFCDRMLQSLNDVQQVIQDSAQLLLTNDKSVYKPPDPVLPPLKFVCTYPFSFLVLGIVTIIDWTMRLFFSVQLSPYLEHDSLWLNWKITIP